MHAEARAFIRQSVAGYTDRPALEIGSRNVNGGIRGLFNGFYLGIDREPGAGVDLVREAADYDGEGAYNLVVCAETLEHAPNPDDVIRCAAKALGPGGLFVVTCAGPDRKPHGCDGRPLLPGEHYQAITGEWLGEALERYGLGLRVCEYHPERGDLYAIARKDGE